MIANISAGLMLSRARGLPATDHRIIQVRDLRLTGEVCAANELDVVALPAAARRSIVEPGDVLLAGRGTQMKAAVVPHELKGAVATSNLLHVRLGPALMPEVLVAFLLGRNGQEQLAARSQGTTIRVLTVSAVADLPVPVPEMPTQRMIAAMWRAALTYRREATLAADTRWQLGIRVAEELLAGREVAINVNAASVP